MAGNRHTQKWGIRQQADQAKSYQVVISVV